MRLASVVTALSLAALGWAQTTINVGFANGTAAFAFDPPSVNATNGTTVTFVFRGSPGNHTVAQSSFELPCEQLADGFSSGYIFVPNNTVADFPTFNITITDDTQPIWFYCAQQEVNPHHCTAGMVGAINAPVEDFIAAAMMATSIATPSPALAGEFAFASTGPGPLTGSFTGVLTPTGTATAAVSVSSSASSSGGASSTSGAAPTSGETNAAGPMEVSGVVAFFAALAGVALF